MSGIAEESDHVTKSSGFNIGFAPPTQALVHNDSGHFTRQGTCPHLDRESRRRYMLVSGPSVAHVTPHIDAGRNQRGQDVRGLRVSDDAPHGVEACSVDLEGATYLRHDGRRLSIDTLTLARCLVEPACLPEGPRVLTRRPSADGGHGVGGLSATKAAQGLLSLAVHGAPPCAVLRL